MVEHCKFQDENPDAYHIATVQAHLDGRGHYTSHSISTGARIARNQINLVMVGEGSCTCRATCGSTREGPQKATNTSRKL